ncbi:MAG: phosphotransferase [Anaerolineales bacterium]
MMSVTVEQVIERIPEWREKPISVQPLPNGITNVNYKVLVDNRPFFVRLPGHNSDLLGIDRCNEFFNNRVCSRLGIGPEVIHYFEDLGALVIEFLSFPALTPETLRQPGVQRRLIRTVKILHNGERFWRDFSMFRLADSYLDTIWERGLALYPGVEEHLSHIAEIERAVRANSVPTVPCHNDLIPGNILDQGDRIFLVDFDYSGNNDPFFELGNLSAESGFDEEEIGALVTAYLGRESGAKTARTHLHRIMSDAGWGLWGIIQAEISSIDFDFWNYGLERWERAMGEMDSDNFERWLRLTRGTLSTPLSVSP